MHIRNHQYFVFDHEKYFQKFQFLPENRSKSAPKEYAGLADDVPGIRVVVVVFLVVVVTLVVVTATVVEVDGEVVVEVVVEIGVDIFKAAEEETVGAE
jgi:hypothetical protein